MLRRTTKMIKRTHIHVVFQQILLLLHRGLQCGPHEPLFCYCFFHTRLLPRPNEATRSLNNHQGNQQCQRIPFNLSFLNYTYGTFSTPKSHQRLPKCCANVTILFSARMSCELNQKQKWLHITGKKSRYGQGVEKEMIASSQYHQLVK